MRARRRAARAAAAALLSLGTAAGCSGALSDAVRPSLSASSASSAPTLEGCTPATLATKVEGRLTLATGAVVRPPWVVGPTAAGRSPDPRGGKGYDAAVGYALASRLGFGRAQVVWRGVPFPAAVGKGTKDFDVDVNQVTIREDRRADVDLSSPYWVVRPALVALKGTTAASAASAADIDALRVGVVRDTDAAAVLPVLAPRAGIQTFDDLDKARRAVSERQVDALAVDFPTARRMDTDETFLVDGELVGLLPRASRPAESYGLVLQKGSPLTKCVDAALDAMRRDGTLDGLERRWLVEEPGYRLLER